jgi:hypothetical protein
MKNEEIVRKLVGGVLDIAGEVGGLDALIQVEREAAEPFQAADSWVRFKEERRAKLAASLDGADFQSPGEIQAEFGARRRATFRTLADAFCEKVAPRVLELLRELAVVLTVRVDEVDLSFNEHFETFGVPVDCARSPLALALLSERATVEAQLHRLEEVLACERTRAGYCPALKTIFGHWVQDESNA